MANTESITQTGQRVGEETTYNCEPGYYFLDGKTSQTVACQSNGMWTVTTSECRSKSISQKQIHVRTICSGLAIGSVCTSKSINHKQLHVREIKMAATISVHK